MAENLLFITATHVFFFNFGEESKCPVAQPWLRARLEGCRKSQSNSSAVDANHVKQAAKRWRKLASKPRCGRNDNWQSSV